jgi:folate-dependent phosphoribosylglycinamide formyltransferase PurN
MLTRSPLKVAVLCSRRAPGLLHLLSRSPRRGESWDVVCCLTSEESFEEEVRVERRGVPVIANPVRRFYAGAPGAPRIGNMAVRQEYDARTVELLRPFHPDVVLLAGYLLVLTEPMLEACSGRLFNVHHADLLLRNADGAPLYPGLRAVRDAILAGERETRATVHRVTARLDGGQPLLRSWPFAVPEIVRWALAAQATDVLRSAISAHQEWMLRSSFGPLLARTLDLLAEHDLDGGVRELGFDGLVRPMVLA